MDVVQQNRICFLLTLAVCSVLSVVNVEASADTYLGCYDEFGSIAVFTSESRQITLSRLTPDGCRAGCRNHDFSFAGLWGGRFCYCSTQLTEGQIRPVSNLLCNSPCPEEPTEACGGSNDSYIYSVYSVCQKGLYGENCSNNCNCKDSKNCLVMGVCPGDMCTTGWKLNNTYFNRKRCSIDINECENATICEQRCQNTEGSYNCSCLKGFKINSIDRSKCDDIDECTVEHFNCKHNCINTFGSYSCSCRTGYKLDSNGYSCNDIDECSINNGGRQHYCNNTEGSFACSCRPGYKIAARIGEHYNCTDIDECYEGISGCQHECNNTLGGYNCSCHSGFHPHKDLHQCIEDSSSLRLALGITNGIHSFIIIVLVAIVVILLILFKRKRPEKAKEEAIGLDVYAALDTKIRAAKSEDQSEGLYTALSPPDRTRNDVYENVEAK